MAAVMEEWGCQRACDEQLRWGGRRDESLDAELFNQSNINTGSPSLLCFSLPWGTHRNPCVRSAVHRWMWSLQSWPVKLIYIVRYSILKYYFNVGAVCDDFTVYTVCKRISKRDETEKHACRITDFRCSGDYIYIKLCFFFLNISPIP